MDDYKDKRSKRLSKLVMQRSELDRQIEDIRREIRLENMADFVNRSFALEASDVNGGAHVIAAGDHGTVRCIRAMVATDGRVTLTITRDAIGNLMRFGLPLSNTDFVTIAKDAADKVMTAVAAIKTEET